MKSKSTLISKAFFLGLMITLCVNSIFASPKIKHAMVGSVETVDKTTKKFTVKAADGTVETFKMTDKTSEIGAEDAAKVADLTGREGSHIIVHYSVEGSEKTAEAVEFVGDETPKTIEGTVKSVDLGARTMIVKTSDGAEKTFDISKNAVVDSSDGLSDAGKFAAGKTAKGAKVTVHYTDNGSRSVARFFKRL